MSEPWPTCTCVDIPRSDCCTCGAQAAVERWRYQDRILFWAFEEDGPPPLYGGVPVVSRPPTNPWRHAYVRAEHFRRAEHRLNCQAHDGFLMGSSDYDLLGNPVDVHEAAHVYAEAALNADWGCR